MQVKIRTEYIKLDQLLKFAGVCSMGSEAKARILDGDVCFNGEVCLMRGKKVRPGDIVSIDDKTIEVAGEDVKKNAAETVIDVAVDIIEAAVEAVTDGL